MRKIIAVDEKRYHRLKKVKELYEEDFDRENVTWGEFIESLATGYFIGRAVLIEEARVRIPED